MGSLERYNHISLVDLSKKQKIEKKRKMNTQEFVEEEKFDSNSKNTKLCIEERKQRFIKSFCMKKDYVCFERINRRLVNILDGLELHIGVFNSMEQRKISTHILNQENGCVAKDGCVPDSCIINIYEPDDCIPPHIDSHDFVRPFSTVSFLSKCNIIFGHKIKIVGPGEFIGAASIPLPVGSVLVLNGNGADLAKHCISAVSYKRISVTFRKMDKAKQPHNFKLASDF
ncbi:hypothetical protein IEQ34_002126 [Dendrobium chrysotoxum]|uniref:Fe2OG dioxygenase domain-containing protein n=1 Tax=Dendrobium chrysotoxum TaxID=161865 RepID=A0AAV7HL00_DENCH|nr:hypothetical protein IEQ34_002126 [Dendrobium chrysotoxum]